MTRQKHLVLELKHKPVKTNAQHFILKKINNKLKKTKTHAAESHQECCTLEQCPLLMRQLSLPAVLLQSTGSCVLPKCPADMWFSGSCCFAATFTVPLASITVSVNYLYIAFACFKGIN